MIIQLIIWLVVVGVVLYLVNNVIPMPDWIKVLINVLVALAIIVFILQNFLHVNTGINNLVLNRLNEIARPTYT